MGKVKEAQFHPAALKIIKDFPVEVKKDLGKAILELQKGASIGPPLSKPIKTVAKGVSELRLKDRNGIYRVFYFLESSRGVIVFHAFVKKSQKTPQKEIEIGRKRLKELLNG